MARTKQHRGNTSKAEHISGCMSIVRQSFEYYEIDTVFFHDTIIIMDCSNGKNI